MAACRVCGTGLPGRRWKCDDCKAGKPVEEAPTLGRRGGLIYAALVDDGASVQRQVLAEEAARITDRLDELDRIIHGKGVLELMRFRVLDAYTTSADDDARQVTLNVKVSFDSVLGEARQQAGRLAAIVNILGLESLAPAEPKGKPQETPLGKILSLVQPPA